MKKTIGGIVFLAMLLVVPALVLWFGYEWEEESTTGTATWSMCDIVLSAHYDATSITHFQGDTIVSEMRYSGADDHEISSRRSANRYSYA